MFISKGSTSHYNGVQYPVDLKMNYCLIDTRNISGDRNNKLEFTFATIEPFPPRFTRT